MINAVWTFASESICTTDGPQSKVDTTFASERSTDAQISNARPLLSLERVGVADKIRRGADIARDNSAGPRPENIYKTLYIWDMWREHTWSTYP